MRFNAIVGNPPYNSDLYLDFVILSKTLVTKQENGTVCLITPAKWQYKCGEKSEQFRKEIVTYIQNTVYFPDCSDIFNIAETSGIAYYNIGTTLQDKIHVENRCKLQKLYNDKEYRSINNRETLINKGNKIVNNIKIKTAQKFQLDKTNKNGKYQVWLNNKVAIGGCGGKLNGKYLFSNDGMIQCLSISRLVDKDGDTSNLIADSQLIFSSDNVEECKSFISWIYTRLVRYLISLSLGGLTGVANPNNDWWRFVPSPKEFNHIFTDEELYKEYKLTQEEINIIESVIKERQICNI